MKLQYNYIVLVYSYWIVEEARLSNHTADEIAELRNGLLHMIIILISSTITITPL